MRYLITLLLLFSASGLAVMPIPGSGQGGKSWTLQTSAADKSWDSIAYGNGVFVAVPSGGGANAMTSGDGSAWTLQTSAADKNWRSIAYGNGVFVAVPYAGNANVMVSPDGSLRPVKNLQKGP